MNKKSQKMNESITIRESEIQNELSDLEKDYIAMSKDVEREKEAKEWIEGAIEINAENNW